MFTSSMIVHGQFFNKNLLIIAQRVSHPCQCSIEERLYFIVASFFLVQIIVFLPIDKGLLKISGSKVISSPKKMLEVRCFLCTIFELKFYNFPIVRS
jgi:hypothetical protein